MMFTESATIYNHYLDDQGEDCWSRTVVRGVQWRHGKKEIITTNNMQNVEITESITIDFNRNRGNKRYVPEKEYKRLSESQKRLCWTLGTADGLDIIVPGEVRQEILPEYPLKEFRREYDAYTVTRVSDNRNCTYLKHIRVVAK